MLWYIIMALLGGWLIGWTTRGIIERHLNFKVGTPSASHNKCIISITRNCQTCRFMPEQGVCKGCTVDYLWWQERVTS